jgi:hypothetical protein
MHARFELRSIARARWYRTGVDHDAQRPIRLRFERSVGNCAPEHVLRRSHTLAHSVPDRLGRDTDATTFEIVDDLDQPWPKGLVPLLTGWHPSMIGRPGARVNRLCDLPVPESSQPSELSYEPTIMAAWRTR